MEHINSYDMESAQYNRPKTKIEYIYRVFSALTGVLVENKYLFYLLYVVIIVIPFSFIIIVRYSGIDRMVFLLFGTICTIFMICFVLYLNRKIKNGIKHLYMHHYD